MVLIKRVGQGIGTLLGLGQEAYAHNKAKKENATGNDRDDADQNSFPAPYEYDRTMAKIDGPINDLPLSEPARRHDELPAPVIIPQKRPNAKARGFLNAYAPALADCGVDQETFLKFLNGFSTSKRNGAFSVLNIAVALADLSHTAAYGPSLTVSLSAMAVHLSVNAASSLYINKKTNSYLDKMNETLFQPHGLFAMIMTYEPTSSEAEQLLDLDTQVSKAAAGTTHASKFNISSGTSSEAELPEVCPLIFPDPNEQNEGGSFQRAFEFTQDYFDRRSQAIYTAHNPNSKLNVVDNQFAGRYANPTTFEHSGLIGVVTGGAVDPCRKHWEEQEEARRARPEQKEDMTSKDKKQKDEKKGKKQGGGLLCNVRQSLNEGVLYLLIVNMPSDEELDQAGQLRKSRVQE